MLSPLQRELVAIVAEADIHGHFAFAGAGALMALGVIDRPTYDVDFFATRPDEVEEIHPRLVEAMLGREMEVRELHSSPGFRRLEVHRGEEVSLIDLGCDSREWPTGPNPLGSGRVLAVEELIASKVLALFTRAEPRDFLDVWRLTEQFGQNLMLRLAEAKDAGFSIPYFREMLARFERLPRQEFLVDEGTYQALATFVGQWRIGLEPRKPSGPSLGP